MHALENGLISECIKVLYHKLGSPKILSQLDKVVKKLTAQPRQNKISYGSDKDMLRLLWNDGITNLSDLTAFHKVVIMFTIVIISLQEERNIFLNNVFGDPQETKNMRECFQILLCYWMWLKILEKK